jgi:hypothetical protein
MRSIQGTILAYFVEVVKRQEVRFGPILQNNGTEFTTEVKEITEKRRRQRLWVNKQGIAPV